MDTPATPLPQSNELPCQEKIAFPTRQQAQAAAAVAAYHYGSKLGVYKCRYCGAWHLSSR